MLLKNKYVVVNSGSFTQHENTSTHHQMMIYFSL